MTPFDDHRGGNTSGDKRNHGGGSDNPNDWVGNNIAIHGENDGGNHCATSGGNDGGNCGATRRVNDKSR